MGCEKDHYFIREKVFQSDKMRIKHIKHIVYTANLTLITFPIFRKNFMLGLVSTIPAFPNYFCLTWEP